MLQWVTVAPAVLAVLALILVPGYLVNAGILRLPAPVAVLFAAPVGGGVLGLLAFALDFAEVDWTPWSVLIALGVLAAVSLVVWLVARRRRAVAVSERTGQEREPAGFLDVVTWGTVGWAALGAFAFFVIQGSIIFPAMGSPVAVPTVGDAHFHLQGIRLIYESGSASPVGPFGFLYGTPAGSGAPYYPTLWHSIGVVVLPLGSYVSITNAMATAVGLVLWPLSLSAFAVALLVQAPEGARRLGAVFAPLIASIVVLMPAIEVFAFAVYPLTLSVVLLATTLGLLSLLIRSFSWPLGTAFLIAAAGTTFAQPTTGLIIAAVCAVWALVALVGAILSLFRQGKSLWALATTATTMLALAAVLIWVPRIGKVRSLNQRPTESISYRDAIVNLIIGPTYTTRFAPLIAVVLLLALAGAIATLRWRWAMVMALSAVLLTVLYVAAAGPESYLRTFTSPWWKDASRFAIFLLIFACAFASVALALFVGQLLRRSPFPCAWNIVAGAAILVFLFARFVVPGLLFSSGESRAFIEDSYERSDASKIGLNEDELALITSLDEVLEPGTVVVGDPDSGVAWIDVLSDARQFQGMRVPQTAEQAYLGLHFDSILEDPKVCEIIRANDIGAFVQTDSPTKEFERRYVGFNSVDTSEGFELVEQIGGARLYTIVACD